MGLYCHNRVQRPCSAIVFSDFVHKSCSEAVFSYRVQPFFKRDSYISILKITPLSKWPNLKKAKFGKSGEWATTIFQKQTSYIVYGISRDLKNRQKAICKSFEKCYVVNNKNSKGFEYERFDRAFKESESESTA